MGVVVGLGFGVGVLLVWSAFAVPLAPRTRNTRSGPAVSTRCWPAPVSAG